jgi:8-oxo-dGTP pyrophosphatase MutT (NUDIX family)
MFDLTNYNARLKSATQEDSLRSREIKFLGYNKHLRKYNKLFSYDSLHKYGILHTTSDVFLVLPDNGIVIQQRAKNVDQPYQYGPSAGGHTELNSSPIETASLELREELGLEIKDSERFIGLNSSRFVKNYLMVRKYFYMNENCVCLSFNPDGHHYYQGRKIDFDAHSITFNIQDSVVYYNQELAYFFLVFISEKEFESIKISSAEVNSLQLLDFNAFESIIEMGRYYSDTLFILWKHNLLSGIKNICKRRNG